MPYHLATSTVKVKTTLPLTRTAPAARSNYLRLSLALTIRAFTKLKGLRLGYRRPGPRCVTPARARLREFC